MDFFIRKYFFTKKLAIFTIALSALVSSAIIEASATQDLNDINYANPAALTTVKNMELTVGGLLINSQLQFSGNTLLGSGIANSTVSDILPYGLFAYRTSKKLVFGLNITYPEYAHISWPIRSIVRQASTKTISRTVGISPRLSYQIIESLSVGVGLTINDAYDEQLNFVIPGSGNMINKGYGWSSGWVVGLFYAQSSKTFFTLTYYSSLTFKLKGTSTLGPVTNNHFSIKSEAPELAYIGIAHFVTPRWLLSSRIYWTDWSSLKNLPLKNTALGDLFFNTNWYDSWSFDFSTRYAIKKDLALLGGALYETNTAPLSTNALGYPMSPVLSLYGGIDVMLPKKMSIQFFYIHAFFIPDSKISNASSVGKVSLNVNEFILQLQIKT